MSFESLKKRAGNLTNIQKMTEEINKMNPKSFQDDLTFWKPTVDKAGNGFAVVRLLPAPDGEDLPWVHYWEHGFKNKTTGKWYIEKSLTTLGQPDPVSEYNSMLWNSGREENKLLASSQKRRSTYVVNILVLKDPENPESEGKVFKWNIGKTLFEKITSVMTPEFPGEEPMDPFDFWKGADFHIKIKNVGGFRNYDRSDFAPPSPLYGGDEEKLREVYKQIHPLAPIVDRASFKSYEELATRLEEVTGLSLEELTGKHRPRPAKAVEPPPSFHAEIPAPSDEYDVTDSVPMEVEEKDEDVSTEEYFQKLINS